MKYIKYIGQMPYFINSKIIFVDTSQMENILKYNLPIMFLSVSSNQTTCSEIYYIQKITLQMVSLILYIHYKHTYYIIIIIRGYLCQLKN